MGGYVSVLSVGCSVHMGVLAVMLFSGINTAQVQFRRMLVDLMETGAKTGDQTPGVLNNILGETHGCNFFKPIEGGGIRG